MYCLRDWGDWDEWSTKTKTKTRDIVTDFKAIESPLESQDVTRETTKHIQNGISQKEKL